MATKAYLSAEEFEEGKRLFLEASFPDLKTRRQKCSAWLSEKLEAKLASLPGWSDSGPIRLGSWSRGELSPKSDVDLILVGKEEAAGNLSREAQSLGIKIRSRLPENPKDWSLGVEPFDVLALFSAVASDEKSQALLSDQQKLLFRPAHLKKILQAIRKERSERQKRHDSISNYLEPQLKLGAGGLRDLEQALVIGELFPYYFSPTDKEAFQKIWEAKEFLLVLRQLVHWLGGSDVLAAGFQPEIAKVLGYSHLSELMKDVQVRLERGSFYADWVVEQTKRPGVAASGGAASGKRLNGGPSSVAVIAISPVGVVSLLSKEPSLSNQYFVRRQSRAMWKGKTDRDRGIFLKRLFSKHRSDEFWVAFTRSLVLEECIPEIKKIKGLTQHDHYHRYTVETHLYKTIRETDRAYAKSKELFALKAAAKTLKPLDWAILRWTALFHDLGKGREQDHSTVGAELVNTKLKAMGLSASFTEEIAWMVTNHLLLTTAAFRQNANSASTWKRLFDRGVTGDRIARLMVFSAIDIRATNPEAWTSWKAKLLFDLFEKLRSPAAVLHQKLFKELTAQEIKVPAEILSEMDPFLIEAMSSKHLALDLGQLLQTKVDLPLLVKKHRSSQAWVRFHRSEDRTGIFLEFVQKLFWAGARVDAAAVQTIEGHGVYDWFLVRTTKSPKELTSRLADDSRLSVTVPKVRFQSIERVSDDQKSWILSFRGRDQKGLLLAAAEALFERGLAVRWARVHTWGSQIDDIFCVEAKGEFAKHLESLRAKFVT
jgi:[protein-PII] uridylyltransferase